MAHTISTQLAEAQSRAESHLVHRAQADSARGKLLRAITEVYGLLHEITEGRFRELDPIEGTEAETFLGAHAGAIDALGGAANGVWAVDAVQVYGEAREDLERVERALYDIVLAYASLRAVVGGRGVVETARGLPDATTIINGASQALADAHRTLSSAWGVL